MSPLTSRRVLGGALLAGTGALAVRQLCSTGFLRDRRRRRSRAAILHEDSYDGPLDRTLIEGLRLFDLNLRGKTVLLKPNLVEYIPGAEVNTNPRLVGATASAFLALGAKTVLVGEGPGHQRDTVLVLAESGLEAELRERRIRFVDLNRDEIRKVPLQTRFTGLDCLWLPRTVLTSDLVVSMPKVKTHHWAGVTLSMKNLFGVMPGVAYGWPKNLLHWKGIDRSILDINAAVPAHFVIADGIIGMEGNGPLHGAGGLPAGAVGGVATAIPRTGSLSPGLHPGLGLRFLEPEAFPQACTQGSAPVDVRPPQPRARELPGASG